ncbi:hypothetical protein [Micromonospora sp. NPDC093277]|uniref:hypothetical protein n=1 Tax=Micromonospora sp. NPDC093277 TaxID=3364291 RepID=UPI0037FA54A8
MRKRFALLAVAVALGLATGSGAAAPAQADTGIVEYLRLPFQMISGLSSPAGGTVYLDAPADEPTVVTLESSDPRVAVPASMTIPAGASTRGFPVSTTRIEGGHGVRVHVTATAEGSSVTGMIALLPAVYPPGITSFLFARGSMPVGGGSTTGTITLASAAPTDGTLVTIESYNPAVTMPASVVVPAGRTSVTFPVTTSPIGRDDWASGVATAVVPATGASRLSSVLTLLH